MMNWDNNWGWGNWLAMTLVMLVIIGAVIWLAVTLMNGSSRTKTSGHRAEDMLAERFARGEIDGNEYRERLSALHGAGRP